MIVFINVKMRTVVCILTFISNINTTNESLKAKTNFILQNISFNQLLIFHAQLS